MASNYGECSKVRFMVDWIPGLSIIDLTAIASDDTIRLAKNRKMGGSKKKSYIFTMSKKGSKLYYYQ